MKRLKSILLYANETSSSGAALRRAEALAARNEALLSVVDVLPGSDGPRLTAGGLPEAQQAVVTARLRELVLLVTRACRRGVAVQVQVVIGRPSVEITRAVLRNGHDLVLLTAEADEGRRPGQLLGTTALRLLRECPCPVWLIKRDESGPHGRIVAAIDAGEDWSEKQQESLRVLELSASVAESDGSELRIVYCLGHWTSCNSARWLKNALGHHRYRLDELLARCDLSRVRHDVHMEGEPAVDIIAALCEEVDVLVMGTVWRSGPAGVLIGDAAEDSLARVDCSVLAVKPKGFITPVQFSERSSSWSRVEEWWAA